MRKSGVLTGILAGFFTLGMAIATSALAGTPGDNGGNNGGYGGGNNGGKGGMPGGGKQGGKQPPGAPISLKFSPTINVGARQQQQQQTQRQDQNQSLVGGTQAQTVTTGPSTASANGGPVNVSQNVAPGQGGNVGAGAGASNVRISNEQPRIVPAPTAPSIFGGSCAGKALSGAVTTGFFGISVGGNDMDVYCQMLEISNISDRNFRRVAVAMACKNMSGFKDAMYAASMYCPGTEYLSHERICIRWYENMAVYMRAPDEECYPHEVPPTNVIYRRQ